MIRKDKDKDLFIVPQEFVVGYSKASEQLHSNARPMSFSRNDEDGARTSHHTHCCIGAHRATHCATGNTSMMAHLYKSVWQSLCFLNRMLYQWLCHVIPLVP